MKEIKPSRIFEKTKKTSTPTQPNVIGKLDVSQHGKGFVSVEGMETDVLIRRENMKNAMSGDMVSVSIFKINRSNNRPEGVVAKIIKRGQEEFIGTIHTTMHFAFVIVDNRAMSKDIFINEKNSVGLKNGDRVVVKVIDWNEKLKNPEGIILEKLNDERRNEIAMKEILLQHGFTLEFPEVVLKEMESLSTQITKEEIALRKDMRDEFTLTIDPHDAKDFDDAISLKKLATGNLSIGVHIADVSHYVKPNTQLDKEAYSRATSVYLPDRVLPMLPEKISNELCSLRPNEDKLTFSAIFEMDTKANVKNYWIGKTIIHSNLRLTYEEAQEIIEGKAHQHNQEVLQLHSLSQLLRAEKFKAGAINFSSEEVRFVLDEKGIPIDVVVKENKACHQLIEELMLLANKTVAKHIYDMNYKSKAIPFPYRIHDTPDIDKLTNFANFAKKFGHQFNLSSPEKIAASFNKMVQDGAHDSSQSILHMLGIRTMAKAIYSTENIGHYGLAFPYYCHFTSPIRRYPDVLVHRIVMETIENKIHPIENMETLCAHCSDRERKAMEAERDGSKYKQVEFIRKHIGEEFDAMVSGVSKFGFWAQTLQHKCEGFIPITNMTDVDDFKFDEQQYALIGQFTKTSINIGQTIRILVAAANLSSKRIDFEWATDLPKNKTTRVKPIKPKQERKVKKQQK
jgi:ribonuclease R